MGTAKLNVWVRDLYSPCKADTTRIWKIHVFHCDMKPLEWCGVRYQGTHTTEKCGHAEIELPPGCYIVLATNCYEDLGNVYSHPALVIARCGDTVCVNLVGATLKRCGLDFLAALQLHRDRGHLGDDLVRLADAALEATRPLVEKLPDEGLRYPSLKAALAEINELHPPGKSEK